MAAFMAWKLTVINVIVIAPAPAQTNIHQEIGIDQTGDDAYTAAGSFIPAGKAVFDVEYNMSPDCAQANEAHLNAELAKFAATTSFPVLRYGTLYFSHARRSRSSRSLLACTI